jgi:hypothetical protein
MDKKTAELLVKIISVFGYIGAGLGIIASLALIFGGSFMASIMPLADVSMIPAAMLSAVIMVVGIIILLVSIFGIFLARGLWMHKKWARIVAIVFAAIGVLGGLTSLPSGIVGLLLNGAVFYLLGFEKTIVKLFK